LKTSLPSRRPIGVFDSGIGGLTALRKLAELLPDEDLIYLGDTARVPYGNRSAETIINYAKECVQFLLKHSVKQILVACNTASAVALETIEALSPVPVVGVIRPAASVVIREKYKRVGVIGTRITIQSRSYEREIQKQDSQSPVFVYAQACPLFVPLIEEGWEEHDIARRIAQEYLAPIKEANVEAVILGCTHYPFLTKIIREILPDVCLIDSGTEAALLIADTIQSPLQKNTTRKIECYMTDLTPTFTHLAQQFLGLPLEVLHQTEL
jgi:glutamate racemase